MKKMSYWLTDRRTEKRMELQTELFHWQKQHNVPRISRSSWHHVTDFQKFVIADCSCVYYVSNLKALMYKTKQKDGSSKEIISELFL